MAARRLADPCSYNYFDPIMNKMTVHKSITTELVDDTSAGLVDGLADKLSDGLLDGVWMSSHLDHFGFVL